MLPDAVGRLAGGLIGSCQPVRGGVFDRPELAALFALAALEGGAVGLRVEGLADLRAVREAVAASGRSAPIVGLVKRVEPGTHVFITPRLEDVRDLLALGADVVAFDATDRARPVAVADLVAAIHAAGALAMADVATEAEGVAAHRAGADFVATTLSGYVPGTPQLPGPDLELVERLARAGARVVAEGRIATPDDAAAARRRGAFAVTVGTAFSRPEWIVRAFAEAVAGAGGA
ncbi:MAG: N-acetylmannosamine-6-phosphate 2-epimerase [Trueperaceae bacterium]